ncbi:MAG: manganese efflux pump [Defluviitaleaceae bacterium]|nr:manganese efflux pump [Defluviitaleaceae bacterium]
MLMSIVSGLVVSVDALFIGFSLGLQQRCKFWYIHAIHAFMFVLCIIGFFVAGQIYDLIPIDPDYVVGFAFIALGLWTILHYFVSKRIKERKGTSEEVSVSIKSIALVGLVMSLEAMLITMGITLVFLPHSTIIIPIIVAFAHFVYSTATFHLARTKRIKQIPETLTHVISGSALIIYGLLALFVEIDDIFL